MNNDHFPNGTRVWHPVQVARIRFKDRGLDGSRTADLSYARRATHGHIWLVDRDQNRDCKGEWRIEDPTETSGRQKYSWTLVCQDGFNAAGAVSDPSAGSGSGEGKDSRGQAVAFTFQPR